MYVWIMLYKYHILTVWLTIIFNNRYVDTKYGQHTNTLTVITRKYIQLFTLKISLNISMKKKSESNNVHNRNAKNVFR